MRLTAKTYFIIFGIITMLGGISGYVLKGSVPSIVSGVIAGLLLVAGGRMLHTRAHMGGIALNLIVSLALAGRFIPAIAAGKLNPAIYIVPLAFAGTCVAAVLLFRQESK